MDFQNENRESNIQFQSEKIEVLKSKASAEASRWEQEFTFKKKQEMINENLWKEEVLLRREEMELSRAELQLIETNSKPSSALTGHSTMHNSDDERFLEISRSNHDAYHFII
ncbi:hypothetical protein PR003_g5394 [Phytophthora rubi]|uniref:Uncharacterized protein n=1 Tax=Phytophthora rubi TaxID=129364 RepID=A0A6A4FJP9_9STRA|nr:hypothetical protein PR003_g5394 [Phytophthora rubi]